MTQREFEERTKKSVTVEEFEVINDMYMACGDGVDKDAFCRLIMTKEGRGDLMEQMGREWKRQDAAYRKLQAEMAEREQMRKDDDELMAEWLMEQAEMLGARGYLRRKIEREMSLWAVDRELLVKLLSEREAI